MTKKKKKEESVLSDAKVYEAKFSKIEDQKIYHIKEMSEYK